MAQAVYSERLSMFNIPESITTDRGNQFRGELYKELLRIFGIKLTRTMVYYLQVNYTIKKWNRSLKQAIKHCTCIRFTLAVLPVTCCVSRSTQSIFKNKVFLKIKSSAAESVYRQNFRLPGRFFTAKDKICIDNDSTIIYGQRNSTPSSN